MRDALARHDQWHAVRHPAAQHSTTPPAQDPPKLQSRSEQDQRPAFRPTLQPAAQRVGGCSLRAERTRRAEVRTARWRVRRACCGLDGRGGEGVFDGDGEGRVGQAHRAAGLRFVGLVEEFSERWDMPPAPTALRWLRRRRMERFFGRAVPPGPSNRRSSSTSTGIPSGLTGRASRSQDSQSREENNASSMSPGP
jgi:hypothetical protein